MHVFVTGATGFVGTAVVNELLKAGHTVLGLVRSEASATKLAATGASVLHGTTTSIEILQEAARSTDATIHCAFNHDFTRMEKSFAEDLAAVHAIGAALAGSNKPFIYSSGVLGLNGKPLAYESEMRDPKNIHSLRMMTEIEVIKMAGKGVKSSVLRLSPSTHGDGDHGFVGRMIAAARKNGFSTYVEGGEQLWPGVHVLDAAVLYRLVLEKGEAGRNWHAVAEEGVRVRDIAEVIGKGLGVEVVVKTLEEAKEYLGFIAWAMTIGVRASSQVTRRELGWNPTRVGLLEDIEKGTYLKE